MEDTVADFFQNQINGVKLKQYKPSFNRHAVERMIKNYECEQLFIILDNNDRKQQQTVLSLNDSLAVERYKKLWQYNKHYSQVLRLKFFDFDVENM